MIDANSQRSKNYRSDCKNKREVDRPQIRFVLQEILQSEGERRDQEEKKYRIDIQRLRKQMNRRLNGIRQRTTAAGAGSKNGEHPLAAADIHRPKHRSVADARRDCQFERLFRSSCEQPRDEHGRDSENCRELCCECQREKSGRKINGPPPKVRSGADENAPKIRGRRETVALSTQERLLR